MDYFSSETKGLLFNAVRFILRKIGDAVTY